MNGFSVVFDGIFTKAKTIRFELENKKKLNLFRTKLTFVANDYALSRP